MRMISENAQYKTFEARHQWITTYAYTRMQKCGLLADGWSFEIASFYEEECHERRGIEPLVGYCEDKTKRIIIFPKCLRFSRLHQQHIVLHEIAHALAPADSTHGDEWLDQCAQIMPLSMYFQEASRHQSKRLTAKARNKAKAAKAMRARWKKSDSRARQIAAQKASHSTDEFRARKSALAVAQWADPEYKATMLKAVRSPEARAKRNASLRTPEARGKMSAALKESWARRKAEKAKAAKAGQ